jgi:hypothetical protein
MPSKQNTFLAVCALLFASSVAGGKLGDALKLYQTGQYQQAFAQIKPLAEGGSAEAQYHLATIYSTGRGAVKDQATAIHWLKQAAGQGHYQAAVELGNRYSSGFGTQQDPQQAAYWLERAGALAEEQGIEESDCD